MSDKMNTDDFLAHFSEMYKSTDEQDSSEPINDDHINIVNDLDFEITSEEILNVIKSLKTQKKPRLRWSYLGDF